LVDLTKSSDEQSYIEIQPLNERLNCLKMIPNTDYSVLGSESGRVSVLDAYSEKIIWAKRKHQSGVSALDIHPDGGLIYVGEKSGFGVLWDLRCPRVIADFYNDNEKVIGGKYFILELLKKTWADLLITKRYCS
jgi:WD40 repeat protein